MRTYFVGIWELSEATAVQKGLDRIPAPDLAAMHSRRTRFLKQLEPDGTGWRFHHDQG